MKYSITQSAINTKFKSSKRTLAIDGDDVVLGPDLVIAGAVLLHDVPRELKLKKDEQYRVLLVFLFWMLTRTHKKIT